MVHNDEYDFCDHIQGTQLSCGKRYINTSVATIYNMIIKLKVVPDFQSPNNTKSKLV